MAGRGEKRARAHGRRRRAHDLGFRMSVRGSLNAPARPKRHLMVLHSYYPRTAPRTQRQAERLVEAGYEVDVVCLRDVGEPARERYRGVDVHRLSARLDNRNVARQLLSYLRFFRLAAVRLTRLHRRRRYATIHVHNLPDFLVFSALIPKLRGVPVVLDLHDLMPEFYRGR